MLKLVNENLENLKTFLGPKISKHAPKYLLIAYYLGTLAYAVIYLTAAGIFLHFAVALILLLPVPFLIVIGYTKYLEHKQRKTILTSVGPEATERKIVEYNHQNLWLLAICSFTIASNTIVPIMYFTIYLVNSKKLRRMESLGFFYGAVGQNLSTITLLQASFGIWVNLLLDLKRGAPNPYQKVRERTNKMISFGGWYCGFFCLISIFIGSLGGLFNGENASVVLFPMFLVTSLVLWLLYACQTNQI